MLIFIVGLDGCGKGTQISLLKKYLEKKGKKVFYSKAFTDDVKEIFSPYLEYWDQVSRMFFFQALHAQQCTEAVDAIKRGEIVIADRWDESYIAYHSQYGILAQNKDLRNQLNQLAFQGIEPNLTFFIDIPPETVPKRTQLRGQDFFDREPLEYHRKMREGYLGLAEKRKWIIIDGTQTIQAIHRTIIAEIEKYI